jgi:hypothetical protein
VFRQFLALKINQLTLLLVTFLEFLLTKSLSADTVSLAIAQSSLTNWIEVIKPFSALSRSSAKGLLSFLNTALPSRFLKRLIKSFLTYLIFLGSGLLKIFSITSASSTNSANLCTSPT